MILVKVTTTAEISRINLPEANFFANLQKELGGYAEIVRPKRLYKIPNIPDMLCMLVDEEGLIKKLDINILGSYLYETDQHGSAIVGDIFFAAIRLGKEGPEVTGLDENMATYLMDYFLNMNSVWR